MPRHLQVNYDEIAPTYNRRFDANDDAGVADALLNLARGQTVESILEVACGTGRWLEEFYLRYPDVYRLFGLDLSTGMLEHARQRRGGLNLARGRAEYVPFPPNSFDIVYCVNALHHFTEQAEFVRRAKRLLRSNGALAVLGMDPRPSINDWYVYRYFEGAFETDRARFPSWGQVLDWMKETGFTKVEWKPVAVIHAQKRGREVLDDPFLGKNACSQLALLSEQAYAAGLNNIRKAIKEAENQGDEIIFQINVRMEMVYGVV